MFKTDIFYTTEEDCIDAFKKEMFLFDNRNKTLRCLWVGDKGFYYKDNYVAEIIFNPILTFKENCINEIEVVLYSRKIGKITSIFIKLRDLGFGPIVFYKNPEIEGVDSSNKFWYDIQLKDNQDKDMLPFKFVKEVESFIDIWI